MGHRKCVLGLILPLSSLLLPLLPFSTAASADADHDLREGPWRAWLDFPNGECPFDLEIRTDSSGTLAIIRNGDEQVDMPIERGKSGTWVFRVPQFDARIDASASEEGTRLDGLWWRDVGSWKTYELGFHAVAGSAPRFLPVAEDVPVAEEKPLPERWEVDFASRDDPTIGIFRTLEDGSVNATFLHPSGEYRNLIGGFRNGRLKLSRFDGGQPILLEARMQEDGTLAGAAWFAPTYNDPWTARPDPDAREGDPFTYLRLASAPDFSSIIVYQLDGTPVTLSEALSPGQPALLEILGTWCPHCHEASSFMTKLHDEYGPRGLEAVGVAFQMSSSFDRNVADLERYRTRYGLEYPILVASVGGPITPSDLLAPVSGSYAFPTFLFIDRGGRIRETYVGFHGPESGEDHQQMVQRWRELLEELLAEDSP